jgi:hypothetical protein
MKKRRLLSPDNPPIFSYYRFHSEYLPKPFSGYCTPGDYSLSKRFTIFRRNRELLEDYLNE